LPQTENAAKKKFDGVAPGRRRSERIKNGIANGTFRNVPYLPGLPKQRKKLGKKKTIKKNSKPQRN
jgi:hypothetical protein